MSIFYVACCGGKSDDDLPVGWPCSSIQHYMQNIQIATNDAIQESDGASCGFDDEICSSDAATTRWWDDAPNDDDNDDDECKATSMRLCKRIGRNYVTSFMFTSCMLHSITILCIYLHHEGCYVVWLDGRTCWCDVGGWCMKWMRQIAKIHRGKEIRTRLKFSTLFPPFSMK